MKTRIYKQIMFIGLVVFSSGVYLFAQMDIDSEDPKILTDIKIDASSFERASQIYGKFCASCHGMQQQSFINRDWILGSEKENIVHSITYGNAALGMVAFGEAFTKEEIDDLASFIMYRAANSDVKQSIVNGSQIVESEKIKFRVDTIVSGLEIPWGMTFLPNGDLLFTERKGELYRFSNGKLFGPIAGVPEVVQLGQGGLLDVEIHPNYTENGWIYFSYAQKGPGSKKVANTAIGRARLQQDVLVDFQQLFLATPWSDKGAHFGSKLVFDKQGHLFFGVGDRGYRDENPQSLNNHSGKIHRINDDGSIPSDNPFVNVEGAMPSIYSYGHRNPQGTVIHPVTGEIWESEHGPKGGDEINRIQPGLNYGWPIISYGINYNGTTFTNLTEKEGMEQPVTYYVPSIAPCGMTFVNSTRYPGWENNILLGSLSFKYLERVELDGNKVVHHEKLLENIGRVRNVKVSHDGYIYLAIEKPGKILRLTPVDE